MLNNVPAEFVKRPALKRSLVVAFVIHVAPVRKLKIKIPISLSHSRSQPSTPMTRAYSIQTPQGYRDILVTYQHRRIHEDYERRCPYTTVPPCITLANRECTPIQTSVVAVWRKRSPLKNHNQPLGRCKDSFQAPVIQGPTLSHVCRFGESSDGREGSRDCTQLLHTVAVLSPRYVAQHQVTLCMLMFIARDATRRQE